MGFNALFGMLGLTVLMFAAVVVVGYVLFGKSDT